MMPVIETNGRYTISMVKEHIMEIASQPEEDVMTELEADLKNLDLKELFNLLPYKKQGGGLALNRKIILKKYKDTAYDPGYSASKLRCWCLRLVPIDQFSAIISFDDTTVESDSLDEEHYIR